MRISWVTYGFPEQRADGSVTSSVASVRYRVLSPIMQLRSGHRHSLVTITPDTDPLPWDRVLQDEVVVFSKSFTASNEELARRAKAAGMGVLFDVCDNHYDTEAYGAHYRAMSALADQVVCNTQEMAKAARPYCARPPVVIEDPYEGPRGEPAFAPGERLNLLWFGHPLGLGGLQASLGEVAEYAERRPVSVVVMTQLNPALEAECRRATAALAPNFRMSAEAWSLEGQWQALAACDAVLIPAPQEAGKLVKSANRIVETLWAGRPAVAQPLPAYAPFSGWTPVRPTLSEGLAWLEQNRSAIPGLIAEGQAYIERHHAPAELARQWEQAIRATHPETATAR